MPLDGLALTKGQNFAPAEPLKHAKQTLRDKNSSSSTNSFFREICQTIEQADEPAWRQHLAQGQVISTLRAGKLILKRDLAGDGYVFLRPTPQRNLQDRSNYPIFPSISEDLKAKWERIRPVMNARSFGDGYKAEIQRNTLDRLIRCYFKDIFTKPYEMNEALSAQDFGTYITKFWYDQQLNQMRQLMPILQDESRVVHPGYGGCLTCPFEGVPEDFSKTGAPVPQCPECGGYQTTKLLDPQVVQAKQVVDVEEVVQGDIRGALLNFPACKYDLRVMVHESSYFRYEQYMPLRLARSLFGDLNFQTEDGGGDHYGLEIMDALSNRGGNTETTGASDLYYSPTELSQRVVHREYYIKPEWYAGFRLRQDEQTVSGMRLPAGVPFEELFPNGICLTGFNDMYLQTGFFAEAPRLAAGLYYVMSFSGLGKGLSDGVDIAKDMSEMYSMAMADVKRHGASGVVVDKGLGLSKRQVSQMFRPEGVVFANIKKAGFRSAQEAVTKLQFEAINPVLPQMMIQTANLLNLVSLSGDFSEGTLQQVDIDTLGGQQLATAKEEGKKGAIIAMKSYHREESAAHICELVREHMKMPRYYPSANDRQGATKGKWISGADLPEQIKFDANPDSAIAQSTYEKRLAVRELIKDAGGIIPLAQLCQADPVMAAFYAEQFGAEIPTLNQEELWLVCLARMENVKRLSQFFNDPAEILANLEKPLFKDEHAHLLKADFLSQVLDDDEVATWPPSARGAAQLLIKTHRDLQREILLDDEMREQQAQFKLQQNAAMMQQALMQPQIAAAEEAQVTDRLAGAAEEVGKAILEDEKAQVQHERQMQRDEAQGNRTAELEDKKQAAAEAAKPKPKKGET